DTDYFEVAAFYPQVLADRILSRIRRLHHRPADDRHAVRVSRVRVREGPTPQKGNAERTEVLWRDLTVVSTYPLPGFAAEELEILIPSAFQWKASRHNRRRLNAR